MQSRSINKSISIVPTIPNSSTPPGEYGEVITFDFSAPEDSVTINIQWIPDATVASYISMINSPGSVLSVTDDAGVVWIGKLTGYAQKRLKGTNLNEVDLVIKRV